MFTPQQSYGAIVIVVLGTVVATCAEAEDDMNPNLIYLLDEEEEEEKKKKCLWCVGM